LNEREIHATRKTEKDSPPWLRKEPTRCSRKRRSAAKKRFGSFVSLREGGRAGGGRKREARRVTNRKKGPKRSNSPKSAGATACGRGGKGRSVKERKERMREGGYSAREKELAAKSLSVQSRPKREKGESQKVCGGRGHKKKTNARPEEIPSGESVTGFPSRKRESACP